MPKPTQTELIDAIHEAIESVPAACRCDAIKVLAGILASEISEIPDPVTRAIIVHEIVTALPTMIELAAESDAELERLH